MPVLLTVNGTFQPYLAEAASPEVEVEDVGAVAADCSRHEGGESGMGLVERDARNVYRRTAATSRRPMLLARDLMQSPVCALPPGAPLGEAWSLMKAKRFRHLPIVSPTGLLIGMVSDRDLLRYSSVLEHGGSAAGRRYPVRDVMQDRVFTATPETEIHEVARVLVRERISALPIVDEGNRPIGILTSTDILRGLTTRAPLELWT